MFGWRTFDIERFRKQTELALEDAWGAMGNEALSESNEVEPADIVFDEADPGVLESCIVLGAPVHGHVTWPGGIQTPFEARRDGPRVVVTVGF